MTGSLLTLGKRGPCRGEIPRTSAVPLLLGPVLPEARVVSPLTLDMKLAQALRQHATRVGRHGLRVGQLISRRIWCDGAWTTHRYDVCLRRMYAVNDRLTADVNGWPANPDVIELALFGGACEPVGQRPGDDPGAMKVNLQ
ncbi:8-oxoguanine DNA glycosylase OGG fold protein [Streptomyces sp. MN13]